MDHLMSVPWSVDVERFYSSDFETVVISETLLGEPPDVNLIV